MLPMRLAGVLLCVLALQAHGQAVANRFELPTINGVRETYRPENVNVAPVCDSLPAEAEFTQSEVASFDLRLYGLDGNDDALTITVNAGTLNDGLSLTDGVIGGTPTTLGTEPVEFRYSDGSLTDDCSIDLIVSAPPETPDTEPDPFPFAAQSGVTRSATITSNSVAITGINAAATVTVANGSWSKNGGAFGTSAGTVVAGDTVQVRHTASVNYATVTQTTLTVGGVSEIFSSTTEATPARVGIIWSFTGQSLTGSVPLTDPQWNSWPVAFDSDTDGAKPKHMGQSNLPNGTPPANVLALTHFEVKAGPHPVCGVMPGGDPVYFRGTIYPKPNSPTVDYGPVNNGTLDKPRVNIINGGAAQALFEAGANDFHYRKTHWLSHSLCLEDYIEDSVAAQEFYLSTGTDGNSPWILSIKGGSSGANWCVKRERTNPGAALSTSVVVDEHCTAVTNAHKDAWVTHVFQFNLDNRTSGGSPIFKWWIRAAGSAPTLVFSDTTTRYGFDDTADSDGWELAMFLPYKGAWHGATSPGAYTGNKNDPFSVSQCCTRMGSASSSFSDVDPDRTAQP